MHGFSLYCSGLAAACIIGFFATGGAKAQAQDNAAMTSPASTKDNRIDYVEFAAIDLATVKAFYAKAFGWTFQDWGPDYASFSGAGVEGGFRGGEEPRAGSTLVILYADDLEASERAVTAAGGRVVERHEFPGGRRFHFADPAGNVLGVWTKSDG